MSELKPCPNCNNPEIITHIRPDDYDKDGMDKTMCYEGCKRCGMSGPEYNDKFHARQAWNALPRAPQPADRDAEIEALARELFVRDSTGTDMYLTGQFVGGFEAAEEFLQRRDEWRAKRTET